GLDGPRRLVVVDGELARPPGYVDDEVVPGPRAQPLAKRPEDDPAVVWAQPVMPGGYRHDRTLGQLWGNVHPNQWTQLSGSSRPVGGRGARRTIPGPGPAPASGARPPRRPSGRPSSPTRRAGGRPPRGSGPRGAGWTTSSRRRCQGGRAGPAGSAGPPSPRAT